jgi:uncharacterized protein YneF (UPF0154 family)
VPKKYIVFLKSVGRKWFLILIGVLIIIAIYNIILAIILTIITLVLFLLSYIPSFITRRRILRTMKDYYRIEEKAIVKETGKKPQKIRNLLYELSKKQEKKDWLVIYANDNYIFYHKDLVSKFKDLHDKGYGEKKIFELLRKADIQTRAEIKKIHDTMRQLNRLKPTEEEESIDIDDSNLENDEGQEKAIKK